jgi:hypothetical protein
MPGIACLKNRVLCTQNHFGEYCMILNAMPISEMFEEKIQVLQANKIGLWDVFIARDKEV